MRLDHLEAKIKKFLSRLKGKRCENWAAPECTYAVKDTMHLLGQKLGYGSYCTNRKSNSCEWVFDVCWCREEVASGFLVDLELALESEWGRSRDEIAHDFQKLLIAKAAHRVFISGQPRYEDWIDDVGFLVEQIRNFAGTQRGDRYLFANWGEHGWDFCQYVHPSALKRERVWLFQAIPAEYDLRKELVKGREDDWKANRYFDRVKVGDTALLWQAGDAAGMYGIGQISSDVFKRAGERRVMLEYIGRFPKAITKEELMKNPLLNDLSVLRGWPERSGTIFPITDSQWHELRRRFRHRINTLA